MSLQSARSIIEAIDTQRFDVVLLGIDRDGRWFLNDETKVLFHNPAASPPEEPNREVAIVPSGKNSSLVELRSSKTLEALDIVFPVLHGPYGEDGTVQGLLKLANLPFVGASVLGSSVGMDKDVMKRLLRDSGIQIAPFVIGTLGDNPTELVERSIRELGLPLFVKPSNLGSSVGVSKAGSPAEVKDGVVDAFRYDTKIILEKNIVGREIECSVLGNRDPIASVAGEIKPNGDFYSYSAKYFDENGTELIIPADIDDAVLRRVQDTSISAFKVLCCSGMARVDMFLSRNNELIVNEINTIPGFTSISMYPKLWEASGLKFSNLITRLIELGMERFAEESGLISSYGSH